MGRSPSPISHSNAQHYPISPRIDEDALEWLYFAFSTILRCLSYFLRKTRPTTSYEPLEVFSSSLASDGASRWSRDGIPRAHLGARKPESRSIYHTRAGNPNSGWVSTGRRFAPSDSDNPNPACLIPRPPISIPPPHLPTHAPTPTHPHPRAHPHPAPHLQTHAPTPTHPHPRTHTQRKKKLKKKLTPLCFVPIVHA